MAEDITHKLRRKKLERPIVVTIIAVIIRMAIMAIMFVIAILIKIVMTKAGLGV